MSQTIPTQRHPFNFTEELEWRLENRYQQLWATEAIGQRKEQIAREMAHILFELGVRSLQAEEIAV